MSKRFLWNQKQKKWASQIWALSEKSVKKDKNAKNPKTYDFNQHKRAVANNLSLEWELLNNQWDVGQF